MDTTKPTAVALDDATVAFRLADNRVYTAVEQANLSVEHGEFVARIAGKNSRGELCVVACQVMSSVGERP